MPTVARGHPRTRGSKPSGLSWIGWPNWGNSLSYWRVAMKYLFILNDPPYGTERSYNGIRLARELLKAPEAGNEVKVFLMGDAASCAKNNQKVPQGYYNIGDMLVMVVRRQAEIGVCGTCMDARGI